ncbi:DUF1415 domain-containing protein [Microbulbifer flavimaris]|uniref:DUF1415 domain-containing protein n=1 Tax=Microbulbifer flavimaris TaxID=1781068 RepID=A0ABX4I2C1_9GAMM|nr:MULTISPECIES: DUF1415 domain-containing protein [Microbulbifer]KUJ84397.1 hypothetical protein AVO43_01460 [Microbulbifer sp. ZGT114]PCO06481.1 DUF1415 domain-containing protein [Microbulbifer flavimaris]
MNQNEGILRAVEQWLSDVVVGLNLCPFARKPMRAGQVRFAISEARSDQALMDDLLAEMVRLDEHSAAELETTLVIVPSHLQRFEDFNQFLDLAEWLIERQGYTGIYQLATFHPHYQFADTAPEDAENLTNRAPYPILHLIREASIEEVLQKYPDPDSIPENNIRRVTDLTQDQRRALFPYLFSGAKKG